MHLTLSWGTASDKGSFEKKKEGELFVDDEKTRVLKGDELDERTKEINKTADDVNSNPHTWTNAKKD
ncbi:hypothetical protein LTS10_003851 [Elasticomyces elasticus]|nr:hypothetical protein LTS10_003851 [Elasticomyces elasticus]